MAEGKDIGFFLKLPLTKPVELLKVILIGLVPILNIISIGYILFAARRIYEKDYELPDFDEYTLKSYFIAGFLAIIIMLSYIGIPALIRFSLILVFKSQPLILIVATLIFLIINILLGLMGTAAMLNFIKTESLLEAFNFREIWNMGVKWSFFVKLLIAGIASAIYLILPIILITILSISFAIKGAIPNIILFYFIYYITFVPFSIMSYLCLYPYLTYMVYSEKKSEKITNTETKRGLAIAALILSIVGLFASILIIPTLFGLIFGIIAYVKAKRHPEIYAGKGIALAAIIISIISLFLMVFIIIGLTSFLKNFSSVEEKSALKQIEATKGTGTPSGKLEEGLKELQGNVERNSQKQIEEALKPQESSAPCIDSDGGKKYYIKGYATGKLNNRLVNNTQDYCIIGNSNVNLGEFYCDPLTDNLKLESYNCPNGCNNGACLYQ